MLIRFFYLARPFGGISPRVLMLTDWNRMIGLC